MKVIKDQDIISEPRSVGWNDPISNHPIFNKTFPEDGPLKFATENATNNVSRQELVTYKRRNGKMVRETVVRVFTPNDYVDHTNTVILSEL